jgi:hypothetical protein
MNKVPAKKIILIVWVVFSILYVAYNEWNRFSTYVMQRSYEQGITDAVSQVIQQSQACKAFPVNVGQNKATLLNVDCLKQAQGQAQGQQPQAQQPQAQGQQAPQK